MSRSRQEQAQTAEKQRVRRLAATRSGFLPGARPRPRLDHSGIVTGRRERRAARTPGWHGGADARERRPVAVKLQTCWNPAIRMARAAETSSADPREARATAGRRPVLPVGASDRHRAGAPKPAPMTGARSCGFLPVGPFRPASRGSAKPAPMTLRYANSSSAPSPVACTMRSRSRSSRVSSPHRDRHSPA